MSEVFFAHNEAKKPYALKVIRSYLQDDHQYKKRFYQEAQILKQNLGPRIVRCEKVLKSQDDRVVLVQEFVDGKTLAQIINDPNFQPMPLTAAIFISEVLWGLEEAHSAGIIHRDLKPENIMISSTGKIKIMDFGVAKLFSSAKLTQTHTVLGSPIYMSPEQFNGHNVSEQTDLYALGVILYQLVAGKLPYTSEEFSSLIKEVTFGEKIPIEKQCSVVHPLLAKIINKSLETKVEDRFSKAYEFRFELLKFIDKLGLGGSDLILQKMYKGDFSVEVEAKDLLGKTFIHRAQNAFEMKNKTKGMALLGQALQVDPENQTALGLYQKETSKSRWKWLIPLILVIPILVFIRQMEIEQVQNYVSPFAVDEVGLIIQNEKKSINQEVELKKIKTKKLNSKILKKKKRKVVRKLMNKPKESLTQVLFKVGSGVKVFLDDRNISKLVNKPMKVEPGKHRLLLVKDGYDPIMNVINLEEGKTTTINAGAR